MLCATSILVNGMARDIFICPGIEIVTVKRHALLSDANLSNVRAHRRVKFSFAHAEVGRCVAHAEKARDHLLLRYERHSSSMAAPSVFTMSIFWISILLKP